MSNLAIVALAFTLLALSFAAGWQGHAWYAGTTVTTADSANQAQDFVTAGATAAVKVATAEGKASEQRERTRARIERDEADATCKPGTGPVSAGMDKRLRAAFGEEG